MKFKEIKPGMVIHRPKEEDVRVLLEHLKEIGFDADWMFGEKIEDDMYISISELHGVGYMPRKSDFEDDKIKVTEFSDLIEPDDSPINSDTDSPMTAEELMRWLMEHYRDGTFEDVFGLDYSFEELISKYEDNAGEIIERITAYEATKKARITIESDNFRDDTFVLVTVEQEYYLSDSNTELIGGEWSLNTGKAEGKYIWSRDKYMYSDGIARYGNVICRGYSMEVVPDAEPDEMSAVEVLEWFGKNSYNGGTMREVFGKDAVINDIVANFGAQAVIDKITAYEAAKKEGKAKETEKPKSVEYGKHLTIYSDSICLFKGDYWFEEHSKCYEDFKLDKMEELAKEIDGKVRAKDHDICRVVDRV